MAGKLKPTGKKARAGVPTRAEKKVVNSKRHREVQLQVFEERRGKYNELLPAKVDFPADHVTDELTEFVCTMAMMGISLKRMCEVPGMPSRTQVTRWLIDNEIFEAKYARAKEVSAETMLDEVLEIADDGTNDYMEDSYMTGKTPGYQFNGEHIQRSKLRVETRLQLMGLLRPKKYGKKVEMEVSQKPSPILGVMHVASEVVESQ
jgi:hypothetical protein